MVSYCWVQLLCLRTIGAVLSWLSYSVGKSCLCCAALTLFGWFGYGFKRCLGIDCWVVFSQVLIEISGVACLGKDAFTTESTNRSVLFVFYHVSIFCGLEGKMLPHAALGVLLFHQKQSMYFLGHLCSLTHTRTRYRRCYAHARYYSIIATPQ